MTEQVPQPGQHIFAISAVTFTGEEMAEFEAEQERQP
jgi:hypothetical protein